MVALPDLAESEGVKGAEVSVETWVNSISGFGIFAVQLSPLHAMRTKKLNLITHTLNLAFRLSNHYSDTFSRLFHKASFVALEIVQGRDGLAG